MMKQRLRAVELVYILGALWLSLLSPGSAWCSTKNERGFRRNKVSPLLGSVVNPDDVDGNFRVRDAVYAELGGVASVIMTSFYTNAQSPWKQLYHMAELNRIQQAFPYADKELHRMLVAVAGDKEHIIGFCDIDARKPNRPTSYSYNPRPYLVSSVVRTASNT